jgi:hypothetical protein
MIWTFVKNMPGPLFWVLVPGHVLVLCVLLLKASLRGVGGRVYRAIRDAICGLSGVWAKRHQVQASRTVSLSGIAAIFAWNVFTYFRKDTVVQNTNDR